MQKLFIALLSLTILSSCTERKSNKNLHITGYIKGLKKELYTFKESKTLR